MAGWKKSGLPKKRRDNSMKKKKKRMLSIAGMCCCGFLAAVTAVSGTSAYLTDHEEIVNVNNMGHNEIIPQEEYPPIPTQLPPSE